MLNFRFLIGFCVVCLVVVIAWASNTQPNVALAQSLGVASSEEPQYTTDGKLIAPTADVYREWIFIGTPVTPNDMNDGEASFPEFHNVYINPAAWREWKRTGKFPEGTYLVKELTGVGAKTATSGNGYFQGEFSGLEAAIKDSKRYPSEAKGWGYYSFGHSYPLAKDAAVQDFAKCAKCHVGNAAEEMVFSQYYPALRAAKGMAH